VENLRLICEDCGVKWFLPAERREILLAILTCAACGGQLIELQAAGGGSAPSWRGDDR
jgi:hypothetical protein